MISIAIDGPAGAGKSSIAKELAKIFGITHIDTGAMYRTIALAVLNSGVSINDENSVKDVLKNIEISSTYEDISCKMFLNGENVTSKIRTEQISNTTPIIACYPSVRTMLIELQRELANKMSVIMDGRDIGTKVLPNASIKIFLTADNTARAKRRWLQNNLNGSNETYENVLKDVILRDEKDTKREICPLIPAADAIIIDTTELDFEQSLETVCKYVREKLELQQIL